MRKRGLTPMLWLLGFVGLATAQEMKPAPYPAMAQAAAWGAALEGSPVLGADGSPFEPTVLFIPVPRWSDGSPAPPPAAPH